MKFKLLITLSLIPNFVFAQQNTDPSKQLAPNKIEASQQTSPQTTNRKDLTNDQINQLNLLLYQQKYEEFFTELKKINPTDASYISYLNSKTQEGHIPVYWLMSEYYAKNNKLLDAHKWFYISLITTQQDSYLCNDITARNAPLE